jgi:hypothetical protein
MQWHRHQVQLVMVRIRIFIFDGVSNQSGQNNNKAMPPTKKQRFHRRSERELQLNVRW